MDQFIIDQGFWEIFPNAQIALLVIKGIDNTVDDATVKFFSDKLKQAKKEAKNYLIEDTFSQNQVIQEWRQGFSLFKTKKGARSSIEALLKQVSQDRDFYPINPLVDLYNSMSMTYAVPCGGEDIDTISGNLHLGVAKGGEAFLPLGADKDSPALENEVIYYDEEGAICRCFNWREAQRTMLQPSTKNAVLVIEAINKEQIERANKAIEELKTVTTDYFNVTGEIYKVTRTNPEVTF